MQKFSAWSSTLFFGFVLFHIQGWQNKYSYIDDSVLTHCNILPTSWNLLSTDQPNHFSWSYIGLSWILFGEFQVPQKIGHQILFLCLGIGPTERISFWHWTLVMILLIWTPAEQPKKYCRKHILKINFKKD